jgi:hypothetical protein
MSLIQDLQEYDPTSDITSVGDRENVFSLPIEYSLNQNYPNPFNPRTAITYQLKASSQVDLSIYNILGQRVVTLVSEKQPAGTYKIEWDAGGFASGVYLYQLKTENGFIQSKKLVLFK